jgi:alkylation response protein AidB-like acyl-CoA dehydrogenase
MLNLEPAEEHSAVAEVARSIGTKLLSPAARDAEAAGEVPAAVWKAVFESGLVVPVAEERGGSGIPDTLTHLLAIENLAYGDPAIALAAAWSGAAAFLLGRHATADQDELLASLVGDADARGSVALYEGYGRGPAEYDTTITVTGDGSVRVVGHKVGVPFATTAAATVVVGADSVTGVLRAVAVPSGTPGVLVESSSGSLALQATGIASVSYDVTVPAANLVGGVDLDPQSLAGTVARIRLILVAAEIGVSQRAVDYASAYAVDRIAFGRPIAGFQGISFPLAEAQMRINELRLELGEVATGLEEDPFADNSPAVTKLVSFAGEVAAETTRTAVQTLGGHGFIVDHPVELWYRSAAVLAALDFDLNPSSFVAAI